MRWEWIVPVVVLAVWILLSLIRRQDPQQQDGRQQLQPSEGGRRSGGSDVDKFLEEINRMRRQEPELRPPPRPPAPLAVPIPEVVPVSEAAPETAPNFERPKPAPVPLRPKPPPRPARPRRAAPVARPVAEVVEVMPTAFPAPQPVPQPKPARSPGAAAAGSPSVAQVYTLLRSPQTMQAALLLNEIIGLPRCRRRR